MSARFALAQRGIRTDRIIRVLENINFKKLFNNLNDFPGGKFEKFGKLSDFPGKVSFDRLVSMKKQRKARYYLYLKQNQLI